ncbi:MAG: hypothetical protein KDJ80_10155 [Nitratireductor sp.]|nr:hypothetical protein [Nitratireductor sp.]
MKSHLILAAACAAILLSGPSAMAADDTESSIQYYGDARPKGFDPKITEAAQRKAAEAIGDLRGGIDGFGDDYLVHQEDLAKEKSSWLGFPVIEEAAPGGRIPLNRLPIS